MGTWLKSRKIYTTLTWFEEFLDGMDIIIVRLETYVRIYGIEKYSLMKYSEMMSAKKFNIKIQGLFVYHSKNI